MANTFEGTPDARQSDRVDAPVSRFRPTYRALTDEEKQLHDAIKLQADSMAVLFDNLKRSYMTEQAILRLEEAVFWAVKGLTGPGLK